ncbi:MAG: hypothetical protein JXR84_19480 [Anaerolineae bacterium]|nr:hypothetical protein [Anaerolineae bacterium]
MTIEEYDFQLPTNDPYRRGIIAPLWLTLLALFGTLVALGVSALGLTSYVFLAIAACFLALFGVITLIVWIWGRTHIRRATKFLASDRPFVRWTYSMPEWERLMGTGLEEEGGDWKVQFGCLTILFAIAGALTGVMIGADESFGQALLGGAIGLLGGGIVGGVIGAVVAGSQHLAMRRAYTRSEPGEVALGRDEVYALGNYFKGNGKSSYVRRVTLHRDAPVRLHIEIQLLPRVRGPVEEAWMLPVPPQMVETAEKVLPMIAIGRDNDV